MTIGREQIEAVLADFQEPHLGCDLLSAGVVKDLQGGDGPSVTLEFGFPLGPYADELRAALLAQLEQAGAAETQVNISWAVQSHAVQAGLKPIPGVKNIIAVASGKGGVGKSTTAVNLALALVADGASVSILDADVYGPSQPRMLGTGERPEVGETNGRKWMAPIRAHGLQAMSIGFLVDPEQPTIWRGPMVTQALVQLLGETRWDPVDYMIIDLPPGTGDTQLTLAQKIPVSGAVIITTPQDIALLDARKGLKMFHQVGVPVLGVIENMSIHICSNCGHEEAIFGNGGGAQLAEEEDIDLLGALPLDISIRREADGGKPTVAADPDGPIAKLYRQIARRTAAKLSRAASTDAPFPQINITED